MAKRSARPAAVSFQKFYLAHLETCLFEPAYADDALLALRHLQTASAWNDNENINRVILLGYWLKQDGAGLASQLSQGHIDARSLGVALGMAALLAQSLSPELLQQLWACWYPQKTVPPAPILQQRLLSLSTTLEKEPLAHALSQLPEHERQPKPWRALHRDLRIALPQPDLRPELAALLAEIMSLSGNEANIIIGKPGPPAPESDPIVIGNSKTARAPKGKANNNSVAHAGDQWLLVLEFGHSRSEYFDYVLHRARELPGFTQIMDEDRRIVYRVQFRKRDMRPFWRLWDYVQNWSTTHVYIHGKELEKWKIWPYSQYMK